MCYKDINVIVYTVFMDEKVLVAARNAFKNK